jgi:hypothetical protein
VNSLLRCLRKAQDNEGDQGNGDLDAYRILGEADEVPDAQGLLDPAEEQFDLPTLLVKIGDLFGRGINVIGDDAQDLAGINDHAKLANRNLQRVLAAVSQPLRQISVTVVVIFGAIELERIDPARASFSSRTANVQLRALLRTLASARGLCSGLLAQLGEQRG